MKKWSKIFLAGGILLTLTGCRMREGSTSDVIQTEVPVEFKMTEENNTEEELEQKEDGGRTLVVYYSATGNTKKIAEYIAAKMNGELFALEPADPYTDEDLIWTDENSRVSKEHEDKNLRNVELVSFTVEEFEKYENVFIGYPIWWSEAAWPVNQFVQNNDFAGKTVIPFCTSASSGLGESSKALEDMAGNGKWVEGIRFSSEADEDEVQKWIEGLGL